MTWRSSEDDENGRRTPPSPQFSERLWSAQAVLARGAAVGGAFRVAEGVRQHGCRTPHDPPNFRRRGQGEGTVQLGRGGARNLKQRLANRNPHLNPLPRVMRERRPFHIAVVSRSA